MSDRQLNPDDQLCRYMDFPKFIDMIHCQHIYMPRADTFDDRFEGFYSKLAYQLSKEITIESNGKSSNKGLYEDTQCIRQSTYVSCWMRSEHESFAHWKIYGEKNSVGIITTASKLKQQLIDNVSHPIANKFLNKCIEVVEYIDHNSIDEPLTKKLLSEPLATIKHKNIAFSFEEEVRVIYDSFRHSPKAMDKHLGKGFYVDIECNDLISEILISPTADLWFHDLVCNLMKDYDLSARVNWSKLRTTPYHDVFHQ